MADTADSSSPGLTFPRDTFARLTPRPFLLAHLHQPIPRRPSGRRPSEFRRPVINTGSLTHAHGSALVRLGDTAIVCGVRGEILLASDIPHPPSEDSVDHHQVEQLGLIVPNLELSTGCSPAHLPGNPPTPLAQSLSYRLNSLLNNSNVVHLSSLRINYTAPTTDDHLSDQDPPPVTKAYWTLYIDILCLALDGNALDAAWLAVTAALRDTTLPRAWWDPDREVILCSPLAADASRLKLGVIPFLSTFAVFTTASPLKKREDGQSWIIADPDAFEEDVCEETLTVVLTPTSGAKMTISRIEKSGGSFLGKEQTRKCIPEAERRCSDLMAVLQTV